MKLDTKEGSKVTYTGIGGTEGQLQDASRRLDIGKEYTVNFVYRKEHDVYVFLNECTGYGFNANMFSNVE